MRITLCGNDNANVAGDDNDENDDGDTNDDMIV